MLIRNAVTVATYRLVDGEWWHYPKGRTFGRRRATTGTCKRCNEGFVTPGRHGTRTNEFCSVGCLHAWMQQHAHPDEVGTCPECNVEWKKRPRTDGLPNVYCSRKCYLRWRRKQRTVACQECGVRFPRGERSNKFCSHECYANANTGESHWNFNGFSEDAYLRARRRARGAWDRNRKAARRRDGNRCRMCGNGGEGVLLDVHHIRPILQGGTNELHNLVTVCRTCHKRLERRGWPPVAPRSRRKDTAQVRLALS
jgi:hypothetical protein